MRKGQILALKCTFGVKIGFNIYNLLMYMRTKNVHDTYTWYKFLSSSCIQAVVSQTLLTIRWLSLRKLEMAYLSMPRQSAKIMMRKISPILSVWLRLLTQKLKMQMVAFENKEDFMRGPWYKKRADWVEITLFLHLWWNYINYNNESLRNRTFGLSIMYKYLILCNFYCSRKVGYWCVNCCLTLSFWLFQSPQLEKKAPNFERDGSLCKQKSQLVVWIKQ